MTKATLTFGNVTYSADLSKGIDISIPVSRGEGVNAFHLHHAEFTTVEAGGFIGDVNRGGSCNVEDVRFNPHGNGTHTECAGHIAGKAMYIKDILPEALILAKLVTVRSENGVVTGESISNALSANAENAKALIVRTQPNGEEKRSRNHSGQNPAYFDADAIREMNRTGIIHLLTDLPSLDKEDDAQLMAHHAFFREGQDWNREKTVTEMVYVPDSAADGVYALNLQMAAFESDASPSKPVLYILHRF